MNQIQAQKLGFVMLYLLGLTFCCKSCFFVEYFLVMYKIIMVDMTK